MQPNNNLSCIPFYTSLEEQDYRKWYAYGEKYPHRVPSDYLLPFYFVISPTPSGEDWVVYELVFYRVCCDEAEPITGSYFHSMADNNLVIRDFGTEVDFVEVIYYASHNARLDLPKGLYYIKMVISCAGEDDRTYYSDIFFVDSRENLEANSIKLEWWNEDNLEYDGGLIPYGEVSGLNRFKSDIFLDTTIGMPEYSFTEEGEERNGHFFATKQISEKVYKFKAIVPEYLCDCMRLIRLSDVVKITDQLGRTYNVEHFEMEVEWLDGGHLAEIDCSFETDTVVKKIGKAYRTITPR